MKKLLLLLLFVVSSVFAGFDFSECSGNGSFEQQIEAYKGDYEKTVYVGSIPKGIQGLHIALQSDKDVDIRLYGENDDRIVHWPYGILRKSNLETKNYKGVPVTYSGYNGTNNQLGHEFIKVQGSTPTDMTMKAFGYRAGYATVHYSWTGKDNCNQSANATGSFSQELQKDAITLVGTIPANIKNLEVNLTSMHDLDIQLYAADNTAIVRWPSGLLSGSRVQEIDYHNMHIEWSGYNGVDGQKGHEYIKLTGLTTELLTMKVYGYQSGYADVHYQWDRDNNHTQTTDNVPPIITLLGENHIDIYQNKTYQDAGATAQDNIDGDISSHIIVHNPVDTTHLGTYIITYNVDDSTGNHAQEVQRIITVKKQKDDGDDGDDNGDGDGENNNTDTNTSTGGGTGGGNTNTQYMLTAWNDLGMHCMDGNDFSIFSILPPYNNLHAQLKDKNGALVTSGVILTYEASNGTNGQINTSSADKTNFWSYSNALFPNSNLNSNVGLAGNKTPSATVENLNYNTVYQWWEAEGLPLTPYNDDGSKNYYPLVKVTAKDTTGNILATAKVVLPVSDEMDCKRCHASQSLAPKAKPVLGWANESDPEKDFKYNILRLHDERMPNAISNHDSQLQAKGYHYNIAGLESTARAGTPILCAACHSSNALPGTGVTNVPAFTHAIHSYHANVIDPYTNLSMNDSKNRTSCYACHPGSSTKCLRGAMGDAKDANNQNKMQCQSCHGSMSDVGHSQRKGWFDEPNCQACHHDGKRDTSAIDPVTHTLKHVVDTRFATNTNTPVQGVSLYRFSTGHGNLQCEACHGATHAIYPAHNADNLLSQGVQGHTGTIAECSACHSNVPKTTTGGPHGMHPVGQSWVKGHEHIAENNPAQCKVCHGPTYQGSALSKTWKARTFSTKWGQKNFAKGHQINCYDCHNGPSGD